MFMYLHLRNTKDGYITAEVTNNGEFDTLGTPTSQMTHAPFAVFRLADITGLSAIDTDAFEEEMFRRYRSSALLRLIGQRLSSEELLTLVKERLTD